MPESPTLQVRPLGQMLLMQSILVSLPDEKTILEFVCRGLLDVPGVSGAVYLGTLGDLAGPDLVRVPLVAGENHHGELGLRVSDASDFEPYAPYVSNFALMLAVILEEREARREIERDRAELEERVRGRTARLQDEIADHARSEQALARANAQLRETAAQMERFLGMLSHELRNPLAPITNAVRVLEITGGGGERMQRALAIIGRQVAHLARIIDDLLDATRISRGRFELRRSRMDLAGLVRSTGEDFQAVMNERGIELSVEVPPKPIEVEGDATRLAQAIGNLLLNAAKFTPSGGEVALVVTTNAGVAEIRVTDNGAGIEPDLIENVFDRFVQGEQSPARSRGGLGLGLYFVKGVAELHGGTVGAWSAGPGMGAEFVICLPLAGRPPAHLAEEPSHLM